MSCQSIGFVGQFYCYSTLANRLQLSHSLTHSCEQGAGPGADGGDSDERQGGALPALPAATHDGRL